MKPSRWEDGYRAVVLTDEWLDFGTSENDSLGSSLGHGERSRVSQKQQWDGDSILSLRSDLVHGAGAQHQEAGPGRFQTARLFGKNVAGKTVGLQMSLKPFPVGTGCGGGS